MKPDRAERNVTTWVRQVMSVALLACLGVMSGAAADAQSAYSCRALEAYATLPSVEGKDGVIFTISPEMEMNHTLHDLTIAQMARLAQALGTQGTTLVILPMPERSLVLTRQLPLEAAYFGFDSDTALAVYKDTIKRLRGAGLVVADPRPALRQEALDGDLPFFATDLRLTRRGSEVLAQVVAETITTRTDLGTTPGASFSTETRDEVIVPSRIRMQLQMACLDPLPQIRTQVATTTRQTPGGGRIMVVGTELTGTVETNFAGYLSAFSGHVAQSIGVSGGGAFAAISAYLTSDAFLEKPPQVLVWEVPLSARIADSGRQQMDELIAAARQDCAAPLAMRPTDAANRMRLDMTPEGEVVLALDTDGVLAESARFYLTHQDGLTRVRSIYRHPRQPLNGRFYLPLSADDATGLARLEVELPVGFGANPTLRLCSQG